MSAAVKADLIKSTVKWGGLEPKNDVLAEGGSGGVKITINLGEQEHRATIIDANSDDTTLPSKLIDKFDTVYEGCKACKLTSMEDHDALTTTLMLHEIPYRTKILRKPSTTYYVLLVENPLIDHGNCDRCGLSLWTFRGANIVEIWVGTMSGHQCKGIGDERFRNDMAYIRIVVYIFYCKPIGILRWSLCLPCTFI